MATLGQKLEEARNRKGISIREAEESTKIRGHFLASFEQDNFDLNLPPVYLSGFLKNYARFLGLDTEAVLAELESLSSSSSSKSAKKNLGSLTTTESSSDGEVATATPTPTGSPSGGGSPLSVSETAKPSGILRPALLVVAGIFVVALVIVGVVKLLTGPDQPNPIAGETNGTVSERKPPAGNTPVGSSGELPKITLHLAAYGPIERLILKDDGAVSTQNKYYERRDLKEGWEESFILRKSFQCYVSSLENIRYIINEGQELIPPKSGPGKIVWPAQKE